MAFPAMEAIGIGSSLVGGLFGLAQQAKAAQLERNNTLPLTSVDANLANNVALAEQMAKTGMAQEAYNNTAQQIQQSEAAAFRNVGRTGRNTGVDAILKRSADNTLKLDATDAQMRAANQRNLITQGQVLAQENQRVFNWNKAQPYLRMSQRIASLRGAGQQNAFGALGNISQIGMNMAADGKFDGDGSTSNRTMLFSPTSVPKLSNYNSPYTEKNYTLQ